MPTTRETFPVEFKGGLITNISPLQQGINMPGSAITLKNFEPSIVGGYRRILGFSKFAAAKIPPYGLAVVDGASQTSTTLTIARTHTAPVADDTFTVAGILGTFTILSPSFDAGTNRTTLTLTGRVVPTAKVDGTISSTKVLVIKLNTGTIVVGQTVTGTGISGTVTVATVTDQNNIVLSSAQSLSDDVTLTFGSSPANGAELTFITYDTAYRTQGMEVFGDDVIVALNSDIYKTSGGDVAFTKVNVPSYGTVLVNGASQSTSPSDIAVDGLTVAPQIGDMFTIGSSGPIAKVNGATSNTTSLVIDNNAGTIVAGQTVTGTGISGTVTVASLSDQNNLVLSSAQSLTDNRDLTFSSTTDKVYTVTADAGGTGAQTLVISPGLVSPPADNAVVTFISLNREGAGRTRFSEYNFSGTRKVAIVDGANPPALYDGTTFVELTGAPSSAISATHVANFKKHIFYGKADIVTFTGPLLDNDFTSGNGGGSFRVGGSVTGLIPFRESLIVFTDRTIQQVSGSTLSDFAIKPISEDIGCIDGDTIQEIGGDIMFLTADGLRLLGATDRIGDFGLGIVSKAIQSTLGDFIQSASLFTSLTVRAKSQYRLFAFNPEQVGAAAKGIIATQFAPEGGEAFSFAEIRGMEVFSASSKMVGSKEVIVFSGNNGLIYKMEDGNSFDGGNISAEYLSPYLPINDPRVRKTVYKANLFTDPQGAVNFIFNLKFDFDELNSVQPAAITFSNESAQIAFFGVNTFAKYATTASGSSGATTITVAANTNMAFGDTITGTGIPSNTTITVVDGTTITISAALTSNISNVRVTNVASVFGGQVQNLFKTQTVGSGFTTAIQFRSDSTDPPFSLDTVTLEYGTNTRR